MSLSDEAPLGTSLVRSVNQNHVHGYGGEMSSESFDVEHQLLAVRNPGRHLLVQSVAWDDLDPYLSLMFVEELLELRHVIEHEGVLAKLDLDKNLDSLVTRGFRVGTGE